MAKFVRELDKIEMAIQALEYEKERNLRLDEFIEHAKRIVKSKKGNKLLELVEKERKEA